MRRTLFAPLLSALLLLACQPVALEEASSREAGLATEIIAVTPLDPAAAVDVHATPETPRPKRRPEGPSAETAPNLVPETTEPQAPQTAQQLLCAKARGQWLSAGETGAFYCATLTRDSGRQCRKKGDCQGQCLARSGTCAPITPLYGCNDVLEKDGREVTLCID